MGWETCVWKGCGTYVNKMEWISLYKKMGWYECLTGWNRLSCDLTVLQDGVGVAGVRSMIGRGYGASELIDRGIYCGVSRWPGISRGVGRRRRFGCGVCVDTTT